MDTVQTAVSKEDALTKDMDENKARGDVSIESKTTACAAGDSNDLVPAHENAIVGSDKVAGLHIAAPSDSENTDDLLEKIEEVVKDEESNGDIAIDKAITESSEQDFLKQLEEAEAEARAMRGKVGRDKLDEKPSIDLTEESVSSSDEKEKAGNSDVKDIVDEPDRARVVDDNAADSTNIELFDSKKSKVIRLDSVDSDVEFVPSEVNEKTSDPENSDVIEVTQKEIIKEKMKECVKSSASESAKVAGPVKGLENGEIDLTNADDDENSSEKDDLEISPIEPETTAAVVSSSDTNEVKPTEPTKVEKTAKIESQETNGSTRVKDSDANCEVVSSEAEATSEAQVKETEDVISVESETSEEDQLPKENFVGKKQESEQDSVVTESKQEENKEATASDITQRMSVDESPEAVVETMDVDEEEKMDVDMVETISDEEMPVVAEPENSTANDQKHSEEVSLPVEIESESVPQVEAKTPTTGGGNETSSENEALVKTKAKSEEKILPEPSTPSSSSEKGKVETEEPIEASASGLEEHVVEKSPEKGDTKNNEDPVENPEVISTESLEKKDMEKLDEIKEDKAEKVETEPETETTLTVGSTSEEPEVSKTIIALKTVVDEEVSEVTTTEDVSISKVPEKIPSKEEPSTSKVDKANKSGKTADESIQLSDSTTTDAEDIDKKLTNALDKEQEDIAKLGSSKPENKLLSNAMKLGGSVTNLVSSPSAASAANVFNSTPIQRQFDISSENVSKISEAHEEANRTAEDHSRTTEEGTCTSSKTEEETGTTSNSEATHQTTDSVTKFLNVIKKQYNGTASEDSDVFTAVAKVPQAKPFDLMPAGLLSKAFESSPKSSQYEISVWYDEHDIRFLSVEKLEAKKTVNTIMDSTSAGESSAKSSSNGSVSSLPQFTLENRTSGLLSGSSNSSKTPDSKPNITTAKRNHYTATGVVELCKYMIEEFTKIKNKHDPPSTPTSSKSSPETHKDEPSTPKGKVTGSSKKAASKAKSTSPQENETETPSKKADKRTLKRALTKSQSDDEEESKPKQTKQGKSQSSASKSHDTLSKNVETSLYCCLAKWVDKKYYAGRVTEEKAGNKFVVLFEDGASKVLPRESIVFGEDDTLPLKDHAVYALLDDDYELGTVKAIEKIDDKVMYTVDIDGKEIKVSASDIYLTDSQAKIIQSQKDIQSTPSSSNKNAVDSPTEKSSPGSSRSTRKRPATSPITPEAGFSGGLNKRGGRKPKRSRAETRLSESTDLSDSPETIAPASPESALEAIEGVQPELQKTPKESEISRMIIISDYMKTDPGGDIATLIGSMPKSKLLFKNKCFLLTCTVAQKLPPYLADAGKASKSNIANHQFSSIPFIKENLRKQIEHGGGKVYDHFEDVPKSKYKQCKLIASRPCTTAKYVQCLAADIPAVLHEWIIQSCNKNYLIDYKKYNLPSGWSIIHDKYMNWSIAKSPDNRQSNKPFIKENILIASEHPDFVTFWGRVCKMAGGTMRYIKSLSDVTPTTTGYMVTDQDFPQVIKSKAEHYGIPMVSTLWVVQSLILGKICEPHAHMKLTQFYHDDDL